MSQHSPPKCVFPQTCSVNYKNEGANRYSSATYFDSHQKRSPPEESCHIYCSIHFGVCFALGHLALLFKLKSKTSSVFKGETCHISKDIEHKAKHESEKTKNLKSI